jgi:RNA polymerase sigma-70 factor (ECF subfamily)
VPSLDEALIRRAAAGDPAAFAELVAAEAPALRAYMRMHVPPVVRDHESLSDLVNSVCADVLDHRGQFEFRNAEAFRGWLFGWARHKLQDRVRYWRAGRRSPAREHRVAEDESLGEIAGVYRSMASPISQVIGKEDVQRLERALRDLPEEYREVIGLCRIAGLSRDEAGKRLGGRSAGAVRSLLNRALVALSTALERPPSSP